MSDKAPVAKVAAEVPPRTKPSNYPEPFASRMARREKRALGDFFGLKNFGVNLTTIAPGGESALMHTHSKQDELIYILEGGSGLGDSFRRNAAFCRHVCGISGQGNGTSYPQPQ